MSFYTTVYLTIALILKESLKNNFSFSLYFLYMYINIFCFIYVPILLYCRFVYEIFFLMFPSVKLKFIYKVCQPLATWCIEICLFFSQMFSKLYKFFYEMKFLMSLKTMYIVEQNPF